MSTIIPVSIGNSDYKEMSRNRRTEKLIGEMIVIEPYRYTDVIGSAGLYRVEQRSPT